jgi:prepilin-type N-terminal cleavage/methylation domain-containing protein
MNASTSPAPADGHGPRGAGARSARRRTPGFTLIELLVTVAILSVLAAVTLDL